MHCIVIKTLTVHKETKKDLVEAQNINRALEAWIIAMEERLSSTLAMNACLEELAKARDPRLHTLEDHAHRLEAKLVRMHEEPETHPGKEPQIGGSIGGPYIEPEIMAA